LWPVGAAAVVLVTGVSKGTYTHIYQSAMSLLVIKFTYLKGRDIELVVSELAAVDSHSNRDSSYVFKRPYGWEVVPMFNVRINQAIDRGCN
jgi:rRNA maturation protein Rpf1